MVRIWTVGHSTHTFAAFLELLQLHSLEAVVDIRTQPGSRRYPQFNSDALRGALAAAEIHYRHVPALGGRRLPRADSLNTVWKNRSFRGFADYMESPVFSSAADELRQAARLERTAIMCAEALWWRCHRALIADYLKSRGCEVYHILAGGGIAAHRYTSAARVVDGLLHYRTETGKISNAQARG